MGLPDLHWQPSQLSERNVNQTEKILQTWGLEACTFMWTQLGIATEVQEIRQHTIQKIMSKIGYNKCIAYIKTYVLESLKAKRRDWA